MAADMARPLVGVLALQGGVEEHIAVLVSLGAKTRRVRLPQDLDGLDGIILPGGESSTIDKLARSFGVAEPLRRAVEGGLPVLATCAGLIYSARELENPAPGQQTLGLIDVTVHRNAFGNQRFSEERTVPVTLEARLSTLKRASSARPSSPVWAKVWRLSLPCRGKMAKRWWACDRAPSLH